MYDSFLRKFGLHCIAVLKIFVLFIARIVLLIVLIKNLVKLELVVSLQMSQYCWIALTGEVEYKHLIIKFSVKIYTIQVYLCSIVV